jgi:hypothetical protein
MRSAPTRASRGPGRAHDIRATLSLPGTQALSAVSFAEFALVKRPDGASRPQRRSSRNARRQGGGSAVEVRFVMQNDIQQ